MKPKRKILVTGATGFIGSFLVKELIKQREKITILARNSSDPNIITEFKNLGIKVVFGDLRIKDSLREAVKDQEIVIHCAGIHDFEYPELKATNVDGTRNLLEVCWDKNIKRFIHISSATVFGQVQNGTEESECRPESAYAKTKYLGEQIVQEYMEKGIKSTILRPPIVYGPHKKASLVKWSTYIYRGYFLIFGNGNNHVEIVHVNDLVKVIIAVLNNNNNENKIYTISSQTTTMNELTNLIADTLGVRKPKHIPLMIAYPSALIITFLSKIIGRKSPLTKTNILNMSRDRSLSFKKATLELGYNPIVNKEEGIKKLIDWCRDQDYFSNYN